MTRRVLLALAFGLVSVAGLQAQVTPGAQDPPAVPPGLPVDTQPPVATVSAPSAMSEAAIQRRSEQIRMMEGILAETVRIGAEQIARRMQAIDPAALLLSGTLRARGFILEGYGVFFDVEIPSLRPSVAWYMRTTQRDTVDALESLRQLVVGSLPDPAQKSQADQLLRRVERTVGPVTTAPGGTERARDSVVANDAFLEDPDRHYVETIKGGLIDAMLEYSKPMDLQAHEWFTVAARDSGGPMFPGEVYEAPTMMLRVKGSDLADYLAGRVTREEVRTKVEVRKF